MMKRLFLLLLALLPAAVFAQDAEEQRAQKVAEQFFAASGSMTRSTGVRLVWNGENGSTRSTQEPAFYVFTPASGEGFVIVSSTEKTRPVLAYSFEGSFDAHLMPDNLREWMRGLRSHINSVKAHGTQTSETAAAWQEALTGPNPSAQPIVELQTALWDQRAPYNSKLPQGWVTGCPATAISIIMRYHKWPEQGVGTIPSYRDEIPTINLADHKYDWDQMPLSYNDMPTQYQKDQVGILMRDVGYMIRTQYGSGSAGANPEQTLPQLMPIMMRYNAQTIKSLFKKNYSESEWHLILQRELDEKRPVLYGGYSSGGGHQFVLDGYAEGNYYHVNWGWSGVSNGYYLLTDMNPPVQGAGGSSSSDGFVNKQDAIIGIQPDPSNPGGQQFDQIEYKQCYKGKPYGMITKETQFAAGKQFEVNLQEFRNVGSRDFAGQLAIGHFDVNGKLKGVVSARTINYEYYPMEIYGFTETGNLKCTITQPIEAGDRLMGMFKYQNPSEWTPIGAGPEEGCIAELILKKGGEPEPEPETPVTNDLDEHVKMAYDAERNVVTVFTEEADAVELTVENATGNDVTKYCVTKTSTGFEINGAKVKGEAKFILKSKTRGEMILTVILPE